MQGFDEELIVCPLEENVELEDISEESMLTALSSNFRFNEANMFAELR